MVIEINKFRLNEKQTINNKYFDLKKKKEK
jgi:hypothetical protein